MIDKHQCRTCKHMVLEDDDSWCLWMCCWVQRRSTCDRWAEKPKEKKEERDKTIEDYQMVARIWGEYMDDFDDGRTFSRWCADQCRTLEEE